MSVHFPGESVEVARRQLPAGGVVPQDYAFHGSGADGAPTDVRLSELFAPGKDSLVIYSMMFPRDPGDDRPGPPGGPTALLPLVEGPCQLSRILTFAGERGWRRLRLLSSVDNTYNGDYFGETAEGHQRPMLNVFRRDGQTIRHSWGSELLYAPTDPGQDPRHVGTIEPLWNLYDLTPAGRGTDWEEQLSYH
jgi:predicted dithiol-disulfide oxidoreductase (DUF899 family)